MHIHIYIYIYILCVYIYIYEQINIQMPHSAVEPRTRVGARRGSRVLPGPRQSKNKLLRRSDFDVR